MAKASPGLMQKRLDMPGIFRQKLQIMEPIGKLDAFTEDVMRPGLGWRCSPEKVPVKPRACPQQTAAVEKGPLEWRGQGCCPQGLCRPSPHQSELLDGQQGG